MQPASSPPRLALIAEAKGFRLISAVAALVSLGRYVAYQTSEEPYGGGRERVGVYRLDGTQPARSFGRGVNPSWSPRTDRLAFVQLPRRDRAALTRYRAGVLTVVDPNGRHRWVLPRPPIWSPAWSPDGLSIAFVRKPYAPTIFLVRPGSKKVRHVIVLPRSFGDRCCNAYAYTLSWSADGRWLAATGEAGTFFVRPTGTGFQGGPRVEFLTWAPRGATAAFVELSALGVRQLETWPGSRGAEQPPVRTVLRRFLVARRQPRGLREGHRLAVRPQRHDATRTRCHESARRRTTFEF